MAMDKTTNGVRSEKETDVSSEEVSTRGQWGRQLDFFLSCLGFAIGLGNVWRFPYLVYRNGGGAFLIPYVIMLAICGIPMFFLELSLGQYYGKGPNILFKNLAPAFQGVGYGMLVVSFLVVLYYNMIMAWSFFYMFASFSKKLSWELCEQEWNTPACYVPIDYSNPCKQFVPDKNYTCLDGICEGHGKSWNMSQCYNSSILADKQSSAEEYFLHYMLGISPSIEEFGELRWKLVLCLLLSWVVVALCLIKGIKSSGKVVYFTAIFPFIVLFILLVRGVTLEGAANGIHFYIVPDWEKLKYAQTWGDAATQIFYSLGLGFGGLHTLASYNKFNNNCYRDALIVTVLNCSTSVFSGFVIFSILGSMAHELNVPVADVVKSGPGLAFIVYPDAVSSMPLSQLWAFLFFFMLITLGLDSQFAMCETLITAAHDEWPVLRKYKSALVIGICSVCFLLGLPLCAEGGIYLFTLMDWYSAGYSLLIIGIMEAILVSWVYGTENFTKNIAEMIGSTPNKYWEICWKYISPITMLGLLLFSFISYTPAEFAGHKLPGWADGLGWLMVVFAVIMFPLFGIYQIYKSISDEGIRAAFLPSDTWNSRKSRAEALKEKKTVEVALQNTTPNSNGGYSNQAFAEDKP